MRGGRSLPSPLQVLHDQIDHPITVAASQEDIAHYLPLHGLRLEPWDFTIEEELHGMCLFTKNSTNILWKWVSYVYTWISWGRKHLLYEDILSICYFQTHLMYICSFSLSHTHSKTRIVNIYLHFVKEENYLELPLCSDDTLKWLTRHIIQQVFSLSVPGILATANYREGVYVCQYTYT